MTQWKLFRRLILAKFQEADFAQLILSHGTDTVDTSRPLSAQGVGCCSLRSFSLD